MTLPNAVKEAFLANQKVSTDTRNIPEGSIFFALKGDRFDANDFAEEALAKGAALVVADRESLQGKNERILVVDNVLAVLQDLARWWRSTLPFPIIGLTGSNGKTTCKELFHAVLSKRFQVGYTKGNLNNHIGVPLTLLGFSQSLEVGIVEMGANHQKEIELLSSICLPDWGYITNYGKAHLEGFGGVDGVVKGKSELWENLRQHNKKALVCADDPRMIQNSEGLDRVTFGLHLPADYTFKQRTESAFAAVEWNGTTFQSHLSGHYNATNIAAAVVFGHLFGLSAAEIRSGIESYQPDNNRSQWTETGKNKVIVDCYNANPSSMEAALNHLATLQNPLFILGDMFELGQEADAEHAALVQLAQSLGLRQGYLAGPYFMKQKGPFKAAETTGALAQLIEGDKPRGYTILLKGSRGMKMEELLPLL